MRANASGIDTTERGAITLVDGRRLTFEITGASRGEDAPVLLLRPLGGAVPLWGRFRERLSERARVIAFDHAGTAGSGAAPLRLGTRARARDAADLLDRLGVRSAHVFGVSFGGMIATWLAADFPERVARLCLASTPPAGLDLSASGIARGLALATCLARPDREVQPCLVRGVLSTDLREDRPARADRIASRAASDPARRGELVKQAAAAVAHDARGVLSRVQAPTLVLAGDRDELLGLGPQQALAAAIPGARLEVVPGAGHALTLEQPDDVADRVAAFFFG